MKRRAARRALTLSALSLAALCLPVTTSAAEGNAPAAPGGFVFRTVPAAPMVLPAPIELGGAANNNAPAFQWTGLGRERVVRNVSRPQLFVVRPAAGQANGRAVLVVPGGGYQFVAIENEGMPVAQKLAAEGTTAFVLVYRVNATPVPDDDFAAVINQEIAKRFAPGAPKVADDLQPYAPAVADAKAAMVWLKAHAGELGIDAQRIGYIGFSAGARTGRALVSQANADEMPATLALIYGGLFATQPRQPVPPLFLAQAADDALFPPNNFDMVQNWRQAGQRVELHLYERGGHGFGAMAPRGNTSDGWMSAYLAWLARQ